MSVILVTRHEGTLDWFARQGFVVDQTLQHLNIDKVQAGDWVLGILPIQLASAVCEKGGRYFHLEMNVPFEFRGQELSAELMDQFQAKLTEFNVVRVTELPSLANLTD